jgi:hypothetical protein
MERVHHAVDALARQLTANEAISAEEQLLDVIRAQFPGAVCEPPSEALRPISVDPRSNYSSADRIEPLHIV